MLAGKFSGELETIAFDKSESISEALGQGSSVDKLRKMGRKEGRTLRSSLVQYALTPDVHVTVNTKALNKLKIDDLEALVEAFKDTITADLKSL